jgi:rhodanese-related sulfurtransferase
MAKTFRQMVAEAREAVTVISPEDAQKRVQQDSNAIVVDVREPTDLQPLGVIPGAVNVPLGVLPIKADQELPERMRDDRLQDRGRAVITTCGGGGQAALAAKLLVDMGFTNVAMIDGGTTGWKNAGLPVEGGS